MPLTMVENAVEYLGESHALAITGMVLGAPFGFLAQRFRFCLRSAVVEFSRNHGGGKLTVWLFAFSTAILATQVPVQVGWFDASVSRQIATRGSLFGAAVGGVLFGIGMVLARGCSSRLQVLAAQGNLRSLVSGLVSAVAAQAAWTGVLALVRESISAWWTVEGGTSRDIPARTGIGYLGVIVFGLAWLAAAVVWARRQRVETWAWAVAGGVGLTIAGTWWTTSAISRVSFKPHPVQSLSFTGPATGVLSRVLFITDKPLTFDLGLAPGVFLGAFVAAALFAELRLEGFQGGAGLSRTSVFTITAITALTRMWVAAAVADHLLDRRPVAEGLDQP